MSPWARLAASVQRPEGLRALQVLSVQLLLAQKVRLELVAHSAFQMRWEHSVAWQHLARQARRELTERSELKEHLALTEPLALQAPLEQQVLGFAESAGLVEQQVCVSQEQTEY